MTFDDARLAFLQGRSIRHQNWEPTKRFAPPEANQDFKGCRIRFVTIEPNDFCYFVKQNERMSDGWEIYE